MKANILIDELLPIQPIDPLSQAEQHKIEELVNEGWKRIAPTWPLKNLIAVNPLAGFEDLPFEEALRQGQAYFQQKDLPEAMHNINRHTIKWLQTFFDKGQATIQMPLRERGLFASVHQLLRFDNEITKKGSKNRLWLENLSNDPKLAIAECLAILRIPTLQQANFLSILLCTLSGWAAYIAYWNDWASEDEPKNFYPASKADYLALRLVLTCLIWPTAIELLAWHEKALKKSYVQNMLQVINANEKDFQQKLLNHIVSVSNISTGRPTAQLVFCIDVRSEPFRYLLEKQGSYETLGFAGFFGVPVNIENKITGDVYAACPVLLKPSYNVVEKTDREDLRRKVFQFNKMWKQLYQSLKYTFTLPFTLVEALGPFTGALMAWRNFFPASYKHFLQKMTVNSGITPHLESIPVSQQISFALGALQTMGFTENFAPLILFCGHKGETQNNAYGTALHCGACGGHHGAPNARILAYILNNLSVRHELKNKGVIIPEDTYFMAAEHNTTTDEVVIDDQKIPPHHLDKLKTLKKDLEKARIENSMRRTQEMGMNLPHSKALAHTYLRAADWAQIRPEWALARNAAFIVGPRRLTQNLKLEGRTFLHSYDWQKDPDGNALTVILTAPMVVAQWINAQYLFSTLDNVAYGGGSKISKNIVGKIGIMQGNASDLMHGLPLQSVYKTDDEPYHQPLRLTTVVYAPHDKLTRIISCHDILKKLFGNGWVKLILIDPITHEKYILHQNLSWQKYAEEIYSLS